MFLVFLPDASAFFLWQDKAGPEALPELTTHGQPGTATLVLPGGTRRLSGLTLPLFETLACLAMVSPTEVGQLPSSIAVWTLASKLAIKLAAHGRVVPTIVSRDGKTAAHWSAVLSASDDAGYVDAIARCMPPPAHAAPAPMGTSRTSWTPVALLRAFLDAAVDTLVGALRGEPAPLVAHHARLWQQMGDMLSPGELRWLAAQQRANMRPGPHGSSRRAAIPDFERQAKSGFDTHCRLQVCFRLELPEDDRDLFKLRFLLQSPDDPSLLVSAAEIWNPRGRTRSLLRRMSRNPKRALIDELRRAARIFAPITWSLTEARPEVLALDATTVWTFLGDGVPALNEAGFRVIVPGELTATGRRRLRLRMRLGTLWEAAGVVEGAGGLGLDALIHFDWQAAVGDETLTARELATLARQKAPLVRHRGAWVTVDPREITEIQKRLARRSKPLPAREALRVALAGEIRQSFRHGSQQGLLTVDVAVEGTFASLLARLRDSAQAPTTPPQALRATLRPYQQRGLTWLATMSALGLGGCLADDMGLGKTIQILAFLLQRRELAPEDARPVLIVAPTSVVSNWEREVARFTPSLRVVHHYGSERARTPEQMPGGPGTLVITTYGLLRRDAELLASVAWSTVVLDEAQNIKNAAAITARAARALRADHRFALTGTPVENRLAELWSIFEFLSPGFLGPLETFRREYAVPIERHGNDQVAARLRRVVGPFLLRRLKSDPTIIQDLPPKNEMKVVCSLTREQATLYQAVVDEALRHIETADGIERRGRVLALLTHLKQVCNHPAHYLGEAGPLPGRSGKLTRMTEMLEEMVAADAAERALVFTQFREMGDRLVAHLGASIGVEVTFLHGGTPRKARDEIVRRFQDDPHGPRIFVLSVKAGGTGLNLTAAAHVFHFDRWWNPAVEDQATDRAYRIGQKRVVQVHKLLCAGTVEEKVDHMLEQKRDLASKIVGSGEQWITELDDAGLRELFSLSEDAIVGANDGDEDTENMPAPRAPRAHARDTEIHP
jgi:superfamily II DNA or RNA helicase